MIINIKSKLFIANNQPNNNDRACCVILNQLFIFVVKKHC